MSKAELAQLLFDHGAFAKRQATQLVELTFEYIKGALLAGEEAKLSGFGKFVVQRKKARVGRNLQTRASMPLAAERGVSFKASKKLKGALSVAPRGPRRGPSQVDVAGRPAGRPPGESL